MTKSRLIASDDLLTAHFTDLADEWALSRGVTTDLNVTKANASALGISSAALNMGTSPGSILSDNATAKVWFGELETAITTNAASITSVNTTLTTSIGTKANAALLGVSSSSVDMGSYSGTTITSNQNVKTNIQELEVAHELLISDLGSIATNKGSFLVGFKQTGTGSVTRTVGSKLQDLVSVEDKGAVSGQDCSDALQNLFNHYGLSLAGQAPAAFSDCVVRLTPNKTYYISRSITIPHFVSVEMQGARILPIAGADPANFYPYDDPTQSYAFLLGCDSAGVQILGSQGNVLPYIKGGYLYNLNDADTSQVLMSGFKGFWTKSRHGFDHIHFQGMYGAITKNNTGGGDNYTDLINITQCNVLSAKGTDWMIDINYHGDGLYISGVSSTQNPTNRNLLRVDRCRGGKIQGVINGNILISRVDGMEYANFHHETGYIEIQGSAVSIHDGHIWKRENTQVVNSAAGSSLGFSAPIRIRNYNDDADKPPLPCAVKNIEFVNTIPPNENGMTVDYVDVDNPDIYLDPFGTLAIENCRRIGSNAILGSADATGIMISTVTSGAIWAPFANVSAMASKSSIITPGEVTIPPFAMTIPSSYSEVTTASINSRATWLAPSNTYYYKEVWIHGPIDRGIAVIGTEKSATVTQNGNCVMWNFTDVPTTNPGYTGMTRRIYRGTATGVYDKYVDLPCINIRRWYDYGYWTGDGSRWKSRTAGAIDTFTTISDISELQVVGRNIRLRGVATLPAVTNMVSGDRFAGTNFEAILSSSLWQLLGGSPVAVADTGDADYTLSSIRPGGTIRCNTPLTANRVITLPSTTNTIGPPYRIVRTAASTGSNLVVKRGGTTLATLAAGAGVVEVFPTSSSYTAIAQ